MRAYLTALVYNGLNPFGEIDDPFCRVSLNVFPNAIFLGFDKVINNLKHQHRRDVLGRFEQTVKNTDIYYQ